jgi:hypothetical protein
MAEVNLLPTIWELPDDLWERIESLLDEYDPPKAIGRKREEARRMLNGIIYTKPFLESYSHSHLTGAIDPIDSHRDEAQSFEPWIGSTVVSDSPCFRYNAANWTLLSLCILSKRISSTPKSLACTQSARLRSLCRARIGLLFPVLLCELHSGGSASAIVRQILADGTESISHACPTCCISQSCMRVDADF